MGSNVYSAADDEKTDRVEYKKEEEKLLNSNKKAILS